MRTEINQSNLNTSVLHKYKSVIYHNSHWHKITVENTETLNRYQVLKAIMQFCYPLHFIPVCYKSTQNKADFLMKNCGPAIEKLCSQNMIVSNPYNKAKPFKITVLLCWADANDIKINIQSNALDVLNKRLDSVTGELNLDSFAKDTDLEEFCPLSQPKLLFYILHLARSLKFTFLKLSNNDIESLKPMEALVGLKSVTGIDLRNNNLKTVAEIANLKHLNITEIWLDGNPLCNGFDEFSYIRTVKEHLEGVEKLDGVIVQQNGFLPFRRNFLCKQAGYDLVDQFLEHYFKLYDSTNRSVLEALYHKEAMFSLNSAFLPLQSTSLSAKLSVYKKISRNIKELAGNSSLNMEFLHIGKTQIMNVLMSLPSTEHDPFSFTVDLISYTENMAVLLVCGVFRESCTSLEETEKLLGFSRTFVLMVGQNGEYSITNEMMNVTNATTNQAIRAFKQVRLAAPQIIQIPQPQNLKEQLQMADALKKLTGLNLEWARKCLEECKYDFKKALMLFVDLFKMDKFPGFAFSLPREENSESIRKEKKSLDFDSILNASYQYGDKDAPKSSMNPTKPVQSANPAQSIKPAHPVQPSLPIKPAGPAPRPSTQQQKLIVPPAMTTHQPVLPARPIRHPMGITVPSMGMPVRPPGIIGPPLGAMQLHFPPRPMMPPFRNVGPMNPRPVVLPGGGILIPPSRNNPRPSLINVQINK